MTGNDTRREGSAKQNHAGTGPQEKELAEVCARFADVCQYLSQQNVELPSQVVEQVRLVSKLAVDDRIARMKRLNQELLEYLNDAGPDPQVRQ
ncbi:MAG: hypothetical protein ACJ72H_01350 [Candidatus Sulfotelmatobacter sp.]|jgi:hypothetical protein